MLTRKYTICALIALALSGGFAASAQSRPNFSGSWIVNIARSDFGTFPAPKSVTSKIDHNEPALNISSRAVSDASEENVELRLMTDGTETTNEVGGAQVKSKGHWDGSTLVMVSKVPTDAGEITIGDRWNLSEDGRTLVLERTWSGPSGSTVQKIVHEKQP